MSNSRARELMFRLPLFKTSGYVKKNINSILIKKKNTQQLDVKMYHARYGGSTLIWVVTAAQRRVVA